ncbi:MAG: type I-A CRISPR-associated protein Cas5, partial [Candidatus Korarchaeota archaeon]|nr:type I-A CRISPR-associated protein Cas5 [Candidatus Korarchaeota archaeon]
MPLAFSADVEFTWGHASRQAGMSKSPSSFLYPPPTTVIGAVAASIGRRLGWGEDRGREIMRLIASKLLAISLRPLNFFPMRFQDINRILAVKVTSGKLYPNPLDIPKSFDAPARGKTAFI